MNWTIHLTDHARKQIKRVPTRDRERVLAALAAMSTNPFVGDVASLRNERSAFRRRVGDWRIFFDAYPENRLVVVVAVERRTTTTYRNRR